MNTYFAILSILSAILCIGLGLFTFSRNPRHSANIGFMLGMLSLAVIEAGNTMVLLSGGRKQFALLGIQISLIGQGILPVAWLLFSYVFARANYKEILLPRRYILGGMCIVFLFFVYWIDSPSFIALSPFSIEVVNWDIFENDAPLFIIGPVGRYFYIYLILGLVLNLIQLENTLRSSSGSKRWQIKYVVFGIGAIISFFIYLASQALLFSTINIISIPLTSSVILISSSIMALFIIRHRLMDVDIFISRYVIYNSMTIVIVGLYLLSVGIITQGIRYFNIPLNYFFATLFVFIAALFLVILLFSASLRRRIQLFINRHFYSHKYEFRDKWMESIERISTKGSADEVVKTFTEMISETMEPRRIYLWLYDTASQNYLSVNEGLAEECKRINQNHPLTKIIRGIKEPFLINDPAHKVVSAEEYKVIESLASKTAAVLCSPLIADDEVIGFILQGKDITGESYGHDDFQLLKALTTQAAVQIKNIRLVNDLMTAKEVEAFGRMSSFIMHDLKNLTNSLSLVSQNARYNLNNPEFQKDAIKTIDSTVNRMKRLIGKLSATANRGIEINKERVDIKSQIDSAIKRLALTKNKNIAVINEINSIPQISVDSDAIEMVFFNLISNAYEAIGKDGRITVQASLSDGKVCIAVSDNGAGMSKEFMERELFKPFKTTKKSGFGIGLFQCKAIVEAHGGSIEVESEVGKGTVFAIRLPIG